MAETTLPPTLPTPEEEQRAKWDLILTDIEYRLEQVLQLKGIDLTNKSYEGRRLIIQAVTATAAIFAAGGVVGGLLVRILSGHG